MCTRLNPVRIADDAFEFSVQSSDQAQLLAIELRSCNLAEDVVAGIHTVVVRFEPNRVEEVSIWLGKVVAPINAALESKGVVEVSIRYGGEHGPDFDQVCRDLQVSHDEFIEIHTGCPHRVDMIGFTPGFSYISGLPDACSVPRLDSPRSRVSAGSVGISCGYTGIYALAGPGGWPLIGQTNSVLFNAEATQPFLLVPGQSLKFRAI